MWWYQIAVLAAVAFGVLAYWLRLKAYAFDVLTWTLESEKDVRIQARNRVVAFGRKLIREIVDDPECDDCIIVGHSLGSCIAVEALLREGEYLKAKSARDKRATLDDPSLLKVREIFTIGSPIDRIFHLFQVDRTFSHRYHRMFEEQRLSLSLPPFWNLSEAGTARITNFWSRFDPISSELHSPRKSLSERANALVNLESIPIGVPFPIRTHVSYFADPAVTGAIYRSMMFGTTPPRGISGPRVFVLKILSSLMFSLPFLMILTATFPLLGYSFKIPALLTGLTAFVVAVLAGFIRSKHVKLHGTYLSR